MRLWTLLIISASTMALSACSSMPWADGATKAANAETEGTVAAAKAVPSSEASAQEQKEIINLMGEGAGTEVAATDDTPEASATIEAPAPESDALSDAAPVVETAAAEDTTPPPADINFKPGVPDGCPAVEVLPDTKSITYFNDKDGRPIGGITARAQLVDVRGGCDYTDNSVVVDIDMLMSGHITDKGRYEGRKDLEAFMTFPYFVAVMSPDGKLIDKKIMATAMRFKPEVDDLDHAEKITQTIPLTDVGLGSKYTITLGFQLNRQQLDYNRGMVSSKPSKTPSTPVKTTEEAAPVAKTAPKSEPKTPVTTSEAPAPTDTPATSPAAPAPAKSSGAKMQPVLE